MKALAMLPSHDSWLSVGISRGTIASSYSTPRVSSPQCIERHLDYTDVFQNVRL